MMIYTHLHIYSSIYHSRYVREFLHIPAAWATGLVRISTRRWGGTKKRGEYPAVKMKLS
jgi:hypothetical protein